MILLLPVLLRLGFWQLSRAAEKRELLAHYQQQREAPALQAGAISQLQPVEAAFRRVRLQGSFEAQHSILLDNQVREGRVGYHLLQPFRDTSGASFLVNRGWLAGKADRSLPELPPVAPGVEVLASIYLPVGKPVVLAEQDWSGPWPLRVQYIDVERIAARLESALYPYVLRIEPAQPGALSADWPAVNTRPEKHTGYAVQWFAMSAALLLCGLFASLHKVQPAEHEPS